MKKLLLTLCPLFLALGLLAQDASEKRALTAVEYDAVKKVTIKNLEKDSYVKADKFILDRVGDPFVFKFSDGTERRVYLYKLFETEKMAELGMLTVYTTPKDGKMRMFPIPSPDAPGEVWGKYIDDLKYGEDAMKGLASCVAFALTKSGVGGTPVVAKEGEKIEYCFPAEAQVTLADGTTKAISEVKTGEQLLSFDEKTGQAELTTVQGVQVHNQKSFSLTRLRLVDPASLETARLENVWSLGMTLEATANHPVLTTTGRKTLGEVAVGEHLLLLENGSFKKYRVFTTTPEARSVNAVYNLVTDRDTYLVNGLVVFKK
ncbi:MAG: hypothetical protein H7Y12_05025 [Sphingobacteriaceae bacterium]|nr:hypothetical protein [Cytophagaceae bacterium]